MIGAAPGGAPILVVGSVAYDTVRTPHGEARERLGGSASHFSAAAALFAPVRLVAVVGEDFAEEDLATLRERGVDLAGLERRPGRTFRWAGAYGEDPNEARTLRTELNVFADFDPRLPEPWRHTPVVFLANIDPDLQRRVLEQVERPKLVAADTMDFWIRAKARALERALQGVDVLLINEGEIRQLTGTRHLLDAARAAQALGPRTVVVKRGEYGALVASGEDVFALPAFPVPRVVDPTGAGDAFAGGFLGYLARQIARDAALDLRCAAVAGTVVASFQVEDFSLDRLRRLTWEELRERLEAYRRLTSWESLEELA